MTPLTVSLQDINTNMQSRLIKIENVQFVVPELDWTYADADNDESRDITVEDCDGNTMIFRNSGYASFASQQLAQGNGSITAIVGVFNDEVQLLIRSYDEIQFNGPRCDGRVLVKNFNDDLITSGGWHAEQVTGVDTWETNDQGASSYYCQISNYNGSDNVACESWLISPALDFQTINNPKLRFINASNYQGPALELMISTDYSGSGDPTLATWNNLQFNLSLGGWSWEDSGLINLDNYLSPSTYIAFKYTGSDNDGRTWEIDDIVIIGSI